MVDKQFETLYKQMSLSKKILVYAAFKIITPLEKIKQLIKEDKEKWILTFQEMDDQNLLRVPNDIFFRVVEVRKVLLHESGFADFCTPNKAETVPSSKEGCTWKYIYLTGKDLKPQFMLISLMKYGVSQK